jgi:hypothetical protein
MRPLFRHRSSAPRSRSCRQCRPPICRRPGRSSRKRRSPRVRRCRCPSRRCLQRRRLHRALRFLQRSRVPMRGRPRRGPLSPRRPRRSGHPTCRRLLRRRCLRSRGSVGTGPRWARLRCRSHRRRSSRSQARPRAAASMSPRARSTPSRCRRCSDATSTIRNARSDPDRKARSRSSCASVATARSST